MKYQTLEMKEISKKFKSAFGFSDQVVLPIPTIIFFNEGNNWIFVTAACIRFLSSLSNFHPLLPKMFDVNNSRNILNEYKYLLISSFKSIGNSTDFIIFVQVWCLKSKYFKCNNRTKGNSSRVCCCQASTSWLVLDEVTPSKASRPTNSSKASLTEHAFCKFSNTY